MTSVLPYLWYPLCFALAVGAYGLLLASGFSPAASAYVPIAVVAIVILLLERWFPERRAWRPRW
ncbi:MAG: hypothetical protein ACRECQ_03740, partial [Burkholderiaceae bacterium]